MSGPRDRALTAFVLALVLGSPAMSVAQDNRTFATVMLNGNVRGEAVIVLKSPDVLIKTKQLSGFGMHDFAGRRTIIGEDEYVSLRSLEPAITFSFDPTNTLLQITAQPSLLNSQTIDLAPGAPEIRYLNDRNAFANYSIAFGTHSKPGGFFETGVNTRNVLADTTFALQNGRFLRGLSYVENDDRPRLRKVVLGDDLFNAGELQGTLVLAGITTERQFDFDPYLIRFPLPDLRAAVATPSTADVYVNGVLVRRIPIDPGQFDLRNIPVTNGLNDTRISVRDAFGRTLDYSQLFYANGGLLRKGLSDYGYGVGLVRGGLLGAHDAYGNAVLAARYAVGLSDTLTLGTNFEAGGNGVNAGLNINRSLRVGYIHAAVAGSDSARSIGGAYAASYSLMGRRRSFGIAFSAMSANYATATLSRQADRTTFDASLFAGLPLGRRNGVSLSFGRSIDRDLGTQTRFGAQSSLQITPQLSLNLAGSRVISGRSRSTNLSASLLIPLGTHAAVSSSFETPSNGVAYSELAIQRYNDYGPGLGYKLGISNGATKAMDGDVRYQTSVGNAELTFGAPFAQAQPRLTLSGGIVAMGGSVHFSPPLSEGFALVESPGSPRIGVSLNNQFVGRTDRKGRLLVPQLLPNYGNRLEIAGNDAPLNLSLPASNELLAPRRRSGMVVHFAAAIIRAFVGSIVIQNRAGEVTPQYGEIVLMHDTTKFRSDLDADGRFYFENVPAATYRASVAYRNGVCRLDLSIPASRGMQTDLGVILCLKP